MITWMLINISYVHVIVRYRLDLNACLPPIKVSEADLLPFLRIVV